MAKVTIEIDIDNSAFEEDPKFELDRILKEIIGRGDLNYSLRDYNGNKVGFIKIEEDEE